MVAGWPALGGSSGAATWPGCKPQGMFFWIPTNMNAQFSAKMFPRKLMRNKRASGTQVSKQTYLQHHCSTKTYQLNCESGETSPKCGNRHRMCHPIFWHSVWDVQGAPIAHGLMPSLFSHIPPGPYSILMYTSELQVSFEHTRWRVGELQFACRMVGCTVSSNVWVYGQLILCFLFLGQHRHPRCG